MAIQCHLQNARAKFSRVQMFTQKYTCSNFHGYFIFAFWSWVTKIAKIWTSRKFPAIRYTVWKLNVCYYNLWTLGSLNELNSWFTLMEIYTKYVFCPKMTSFELYKGGCSVAGYICTQTALEVISCFDSYWHCAWVWSGRYQLSQWYCVTDWGQTC